MKKLFYILTLFITFLSFNSCNNEGSRNLKYDDNFSNGKAGEVMLVIDSNYWKPAAFDSINHVLLQPQQSLNQAEPMFDILSFNSNDFTAYFQRHRNIIHFDVNPNYSLNSFSIDDNVWASPQIYVHIKGNNPDSCLSLFMKNKKLILQKLYDNDLRRLQVFYKQHNNPETEKIIKKKFDIGITIPYQYTLELDTLNYIGLRFWTAKNDRFISIYKCPAKELNKENIIASLNEMYQKYFEGAVAGAYPKIADDYDPIANAVKIHGKIGIEMKGLWNSSGDYMGGPFVSFSFYDNSKENIINVFGFLYAPEENKRDFLREVEAIVKTVQ